MLQQLTKDEYKGLSEILDTYALRGRGKYSQLRPEHRKTPTFEVPCVTSHCERCHILFPYHRLSRHKHKYGCTYSYYSLEGLMRRMKKLLDWTEEQGFVQNPNISLNDKWGVAYQPQTKNIERQALYDFIDLVLAAGRRRSVPPYEIATWGFLCVAMPNCSTCTYLFPYKNREGFCCPPVKYKTGSILRRAYKLLKSCEAENETIC